LPAAFVDDAFPQGSSRRNNCVFTPLVVLWLLVWQRLCGGAPLEAAVLALSGLPASFWPRPCKRIRQWREHGKPLSSHTGAYTKARQILPLSVVEQSCDRIFEQLDTRMAAARPASSVRAFLLDGTSVRLAHSPALVRRFPLGRNQHGQGHWPLLRVLVAHDVYTGLALRPEWGPLDGPEAVSEQRLLDAAIGRLPDGAAVIGDRNFGVFSVAYAGAQANHPVLLRLTNQRAQRLAGEPLRGEMDRVVVWKPTREDRKSHPGLPVDACVHGRLVVRQVRRAADAAPFLLILFTTLPEAVPALLQLYAQRWNIETDLRTLKRELRLEQLTAATPEMAAKEIQMSIAAYNLVRTVIWTAAQQSGLAPRGYGFTKVRRILETFLPLLATAPDQLAAQRLFNQMMYYVQQAKLPHRRRPRPSYPRAIWGCGGKFPHRRT
jgi:hypothetical protein